MKIIYIFGNQNDYSQQSMRHLKKQIEETGSIFLPKRTKLIIKLHAEKNQISHEKQVWKRKTLVTASIQT